MHDVRHRKDIEAIVAEFYKTTSADPIIGFIFNDVAKIDLTSHLPLICDFWEDALFSGEQKRYTRNTLSVHLELAQKVTLRAGHFTRWLYLFERAVDHNAAGQQAERMKQRANNVAKSIAAALTAGKRSSMQLRLDEQK